jgi:hypothetical protein
VKATANANKALTQNLTLEEIHKVIQALPKGKAPGHNGIPIEFFQACASEVAPTMLKAYTAMLASGETSNYINRGLITLIPKTETAPNSGIRGQSLSWGMFIKFWPKPSPRGCKPSSQVLSGRIKLAS